MIARTRASAAQSVFAAKYLVNALHTRIGLCHEPAVWLHRVTLCSGECTLLPSDGEQTSPPATEAQPESEFGACQSSSGQSGQSVGTLARDCCYWRVSGTCPCTCACGVVCMHCGRGRSSINSGLIDVSGQRYPATNSSNGASPVRFCPYARAGLLRGSVEGCVGCLSHRVMLPPQPECRLPNRHRHTETANTSRWGRPMGEEGAVRMQS